MQTFCKTLLPLLINGAKVVGMLVGPPPRFNDQMMLFKILHCTKQSHKIFPQSETPYGVTSYPLLAHIIIYTSLSCTFSRSIQQSKYMRSIIHKFDKSDGFSKKKTLNTNHKCTMYQYRQVHRYNIKIHGAFSQHCIFKIGTKCTVAYCADFMTIFQYNSIQVCKYISGCQTPITAFPERALQLFLSRQTKYKTSKFKSTQKTTNNTKIESWMRIKGKQIRGNYLLVGKYKSQSYQGADFISKPIFSM